MDATTVTTLATPFAVIALTTFAKDLGLPTKLAGAAAVLFGIALSLADYCLAGTGVYGAVVSGAYLAVGGAGGYDLARTIGKAISAPADGAPGAPTA